MSGARKVTLLWSTCSISLLVPSQLQENEYFSSATGLFHFCGVSMKDEYPLWLLPFFCIIVDRQRIHLL